ncbi:MAG: DUF5076 domain-containing protein [Cyanobacteria bacterium HKST-UBA02]|nr:DUF5076 domain-containing protein [Cyanobacteria bacterium HKST-UBA02]
MTSQLIIPPEVADEPEAFELFRLWVLDQNLHMVAALLDHFTIEDYAFVIACLGNHMVSSNQQDENQTRETVAGQVIEKLSSLYDAFRADGGLDDDA